MRSAILPGYSSRSDRAKPPARAVANLRPKGIANHGRRPGDESRLLYREAIMDEHLAAWEITEFIVGGLDEDDLIAV